MTLYNNFLLKRGVGLFSRVGLISGDYGILLCIPCTFICILYTYIIKYMYLRIICLWGTTGMYGSTVILAYTVNYCCI